MALATVGLDLSGRQLEHAHRLMAEASVEFPLIHASAEAGPRPDASFDIVFRDREVVPGLCITGLECRRPDRG